MKRVKVIREMPFVKVGDIIEVNDYGFIEDDDTPTLYNGIYACSFTEAGWCEWVEEEESLEEKFKSYLDEKNRLIISENNWREMLAIHFKKIAHDHYKELFDKAYKKWDTDYDNNLEEVDYIRKALFNEEDV